MCSKLTTNLMGKVPNNFKQKLVENNPYLLGSQLGYELGSGGAGLSASSATAIMNMISNSIAEQQRKNRIISELSAITPTLSRLNEMDKGKAFKKLRIVDDVDQKLNWIEQNYTQKTVNIAKFYNGYMELSTEPNFAKNRKGGNMMLVTSEGAKQSTKALPTYANNEKFDFSKDFIMNMYLKFSDKGNNTLDVFIGNGYRLTLDQKKQQIEMSTPNLYEITAEFAKFDTAKDPLAVKRNEKDAAGNTLKVTPK
jgi:hypothetical protein